MRPLPISSLGGQAYGGGVPNAGLALWKGEVSSLAAGLVLLRALGGGRGARILGNRPRSETRHRQTSIPCG